MQTGIYSLEGKKKEKLDLPSSFMEEIRPDIVKKAIESFEANKKQPYGPSPEAGMRHATEMEGVGQGMARVQRLTQYGGARAAESPQARGGRKAHPPKAEKKLGKKLNRQAKAKARRSALAAMTDIELIKNRGHEIKDDDSLEFPIVVEDEIEDLHKTKEAVDLLEKLGIYSDIERAKKGKNIRSGKGKMRNRKYRTPKSLLVVLSENADGRRAFSNLPGVTVKSPKNLTIDDMAPGGTMGRLAIFSVKAIEELEDW
ncbi:MAG: 50S ribosomal protein L4 [Candidatus Thermoplasmatota archaeon]|nr:50S ribosomal protein L4 [Candidatus Thermoplasmatota archaeon]MBS3789874.1 50S ribosomal protein L4 [Candidatus Thermoplasmatota archaeon]